jgi:hypothetical protein
MDMLFVQPLNPNLGLEVSLAGRLPYSVLSEKKRSVTRSSGPSVPLGK